MSGKRTATTELNHDNWNEENEPEDAGVFALASNDILEKRVIKTARRRLPSKDGIPTKSAFGSFAGFKTNPSLSPFGFLANTSTTSSTTTSTASATTVNTSNKQTASNGAPKIPEIDTDKREDFAHYKLQTSSTSTSKKNSVEQGTEKTRSHSSDYYAKLKGLNESVATWIKSHVDANPFCILTPIFKDYERYLKEITSKEESSKTQISHTSSEHITQAAKNDIKEISSEKKPEKSLFGNSNANAKSTLITGTELKPEKSIFSNITTNTKSVFSNTEQKTENSKSVFGSTDVTPDKNKSIFGSTESNVASKSVFGNTNVESSSFANKSTISDSGNKDEEETSSNAKSVAPTFPTFSFGQSSTTSNVSAGFSFGSAKPFSFAPQTVKPQEKTEDKASNENKDEEDEEPPKQEFKLVTEEGATYEQRCKVFVKKDSVYTDRGIGMLYLKPTPNGKTQLIVRANTALGNLLLNTLLTQSIPTKRMNKNTIMLVCLPMPDSSPPPVSVLLRVKTSENADELLEALNKHKK
ncbi:Nuclear pore complex protein Nup50 [Trachymyrmex septentrionalis]|uniref:Nuclear pore complex protein Nup50 n=1 Tax=Trachymyrmex septentrionalis TaxID=34720 RepID=A0A195FDX3_9HYME|nr:PREDICTED: nuclear pore complex protein Nup50 [Trachymyrmex septentrionalis]XP_018343418.1 PREDICTED: nuclear pore complex protein Nup50 [Trachymyrmex septentrionalis]XP_018343419.1 PREDICTED: nuclear pore complex protein Nup50 [Trachymyrmex septentrionalis]XP_018343420.1 PREDICTED: nuclear pore complex protein Nup50 [Trachymyrmex septentrionalis]KYN38402.1 Nuclear pore complex protein Nup50 [Trachymyrmex septentrionalis]